MLAADDGDHQRQAEIPGANEGAGRASDAEPDGQGVLQRARVNALPGKRRTVPARPMNVGLLADFQEQIEVLGKERIVILELKSEERECLDERAAPGDDLGPALREEIERGEFLKHADGIGRAQNGDGAGKPDTPGAGRGRGEDHGGRGIEELTAMVFADAKHIEAHFVSESDRFEQLAEMSRWVDGLAGGAVNRGRHETVYADFHIIPFVGFEIKTRRLY
jgi:hypothetical protein